MTTLLDFEKPILELEGKVKELRLLSDGGELDISDEVARLEGRASKLLSQTYAKLTAWQKTQVARHADRPHFKDYAEALIEDFTPLAGDRLYGEDRAIVGGLGRFRGLAVMVIGHEKGADTDNRRAPQFRHGPARGLPQGGPADAAGRAVPPAGADLRRHARRPSRHRRRGARPGRGDRPRDRGLPVARGAAGRHHRRRGRLGRGHRVGRRGPDPDARALDLFGDLARGLCRHPLARHDQAPTAAEALKLTAQDLFGHRLVDQVIPEPMGGAHRGRATTIAAVGDAIEQQLRPLLRLSGAELKRSRRDKFLRMGQPPEPKAAAPAA